MFSLYWTNEGAGKGVVGTYTTFRKLVASARDFVDAHQPSYRTERSVWYDLIATETVVDAPATLQKRYYQFDKTGAVTERIVWRVIDPDPDSEFDDEPDDMDNDNDDEAAETSDDESVHPAVAVRKVDYGPLDQPSCGDIVTIQYNADPDTHIPERIQFSDDTTWYTIDYSSSAYVMGKGYLIRIQGDDWYMSSMDVGDTHMRFVNYNTRMAFVAEYDEVPASY